MNIIPGYVLELLYDDWMYLGGLYRCSLNRKIKCLDTNIIRALLHTEFYYL